MAEIFVNAYAKSFDIPSIIVRRNNESASTAKAHTLGRRLLTNIYRPLTMTITEPIVLTVSFYSPFSTGILTFFNKHMAFPCPRLSYLLWLALSVRDFIALPLIPLIYKWSKRVATEGKLVPEICLWHGMLGGSIMLPVSLWWLAWTCYVRLTYCLSNPPRSCQS